jgi:hypothetical protein
VAYCNVLSSYSLGRNEEARKNSKSFYFLNRAIYPKFICTDPVILLRVNFPCHSCEGCVNTLYILFISFFNDSFPTA